MRITEFRVKDGEAMADEQNASALLRELEENNRELQMLSANIPGGLFRCRYDEQLTILQMTDGFLRLVGYTREEIAQQFHNSFWQMIVPADRESSRREVIRQLKQGIPKRLNTASPVRTAASSGCWIAPAGAGSGGKSNLFLYPSGQYQGPAFAGAAEVEPGAASDHYGSIQRHHL
jgi:PAS domain-containing protein